MKVKLNSVGFTEEKYLKASGVLNQIGIVSSTIGLGLITAAHIIKKRTTRWFIDADGSWLEPFSKFYKELDEAGK